jgi:hypothetical protein
VRGAWCETRIPGAGIVADEGDARISVFELHRLQEIGEADAHDRADAVDGLKQPPGFRVRRTLPYLWSICLNVAFLPARLVSPFSA